ncbi:MAG: nitric oxide reductase activation protein NorD [Actinomycetota bacterium]
MDAVQARKRLRCDFAEVDAVFADSLVKAQALLSPAGVEAWLAGAARLAEMVLRPEAVVAFLDAVPDVARAAGDEAVIEAASDAAAYLAGLRDVQAAAPFLATLAPVARRLESAEALAQWFALLKRITIDAREGLLPLLTHAPQLLEMLTIGGLVNWAGFAIEAYRDRSYQRADYFSLQTADAHAILARERHGTLFADHARGLVLTLLALWGLEVELRPFSLAFDSRRQPMPHIDRRGFHLPDVLDAENGVSGLDRYRAMVAHMAAHKLWSRPMLADNYSPFQHLAVEAFEDARVEALAIRRWPGLRRLWLALHPMPAEDACPEGFSPIRHKLAMLSRALLDPNHPYRDPLLLAAVERFHAEMERAPFDPAWAAEMGVHYLARIHQPSFHSSKVWFDDTVVSFRDDNRWLWHFLEDVKDTTQFHSDHGTDGDDNPPTEPDAGRLMLPRHYPEWDYASAEYRPDWTTVYEAIQAPGDEGVVDALLARNSVLARRIKHLVDRLEPDRRRRVRRQEEGEELDLDMAIAAMIDLAAGTIPDGRVYQSWRRGERDIAVMLLVDVSESLAAKAEGVDGTLLDLAREAASLLAWAVDALGDPLAIAGFATRTRHEVRYMHYKGFTEAWGALPKARLAAMGAGASTRMGAALRHAGHQLEARPEARKLLLLLTDGKPSDIDVDDEDYLKWDTHMAVRELGATGVSTFCITLDPKADEYVADIFGANGYAVVDRVARLPETLTRLFLALTR